MTELNNHPSNQSKVIQELVGEIEILRMKRRSAYNQCPHPMGKRFTQEELRDEAYPSFKHLLLGNTQRLPSRVAIMCIADYLECTLHERNDLLIAAQYLPEPTELTEHQLTTALDAARQVMKMLPFPALLVTRDWTVHAMNTQCSALFGTPFWTQIPEKQRTLLHLVFDPTLPFRERATVTESMWRRQHAEQCVHLFKSHNVIYQYETWFQQRVEHLRTLPDFNTCWDGTNAHASEPKGFLAGPAGVLIHFNPVLITPGATSYPTIAAYIPVDDAAQYIFTKLADE